MSLDCIEKLVKHFKIDIVGIIKPFHKVVDIQRYAFALSFSYFCTNESSGRKLWVMWKDGCSFGVISNSEQMPIGWLTQNGLKSQIYFEYAKCDFYDWRKLSTNLKGINDGLAS